MEDYIEVEPIEAESMPAPAGEIEVVYTPSSISDNIEAVAAYVDAQLEPYAGAQIDPADAAQLKAARKAMADLNKMKRPIDAERKRVKHEYMAPLNSFEERVKAITAKIDAARTAIKEQVDAADAAFQAARRAMLEDEWDGCAGVLADVIPFDAVLEPSWLNRSTAEQKAMRALYDKAQAALEGYNALSGRELVHRDEVIRRYCETLDLTAALKLEDELLAEDARMAEWKAAQEAAEAERTAREAAWRAEAAMQEAAVAEEPASPAPEPEYVWALSMEFTGTQEFARSIAALLKANGVTGATIKCMREVPDA